MINNQLTEVCKEDGVMSKSFLSKAQDDKYVVYNVCEFTDMEIRLDAPEYRNGVKYRVKLGDQG